jgi:hypothetical protein
MGGIYGEGTYLQVFDSPYPDFGSYGEASVGGYNSDLGNSLPGKMVLQNDGDLVLLDGLGSVTWRSNTPTSC